MLSMLLEQKVRKLLGQRSLALKAVSGGDAARAFRVVLPDGRALFCKYVRAEDPASAGRFAAEALALRRMAATRTFVVPEPVAHDEELLILQWLDLGRGDSRWEERFGRTLARFHQATKSERYGFDTDNWLGKRVQHNDWTAGWMEFWNVQRLLPQLEALRQRLGDSDALVRALDRLSGRLPALLDGVERRPVLLHGDLWSGNVAAGPEGRPVILDPAAYYGDREAEFGMLRLFGGFSPRCEAAYNEVWPFEAGFEDRVLLYRLYHEVNHLLIFGSAYYSASLATARTLL